MAKRVTAILLILAMAVAFTACTPQTATSSAPSSGAAESPGSSAAAGTTAAAGSNDVFKIGLYLQLTGPNSAGATQGKKAMEIGADYINKNGGFNGAKVEIVCYDTQASAEESVKCVTKLLEKDKVNAVISSLASNEILPVREMVNNAGLLHMNVGSSPTTMKENYDFFFRGAYNSNFGAPTYAKIIHDDLGLTKAAVLYGQDDTSFANGKAIIEEFEKIGIEVCAKETFDMGDVDYSAQIRNILNSKPQTIYCVVNAEINQIIKQFRQNGYTGLIFNKDSISSSAFEVAGKEACNYVVSVAPYVTYIDSADCDVPKAKEFLDIWDAATNKTPLQSWGVYAMWDSLMILWEASKKAGSNDPVKMRDAILTFNNYEACGGIMDFTQGDREGYHTLGAFIMIDGKYQNFDSWLKNGGYEAYKKATGNAY